MKLDTNEQLSDIVILALHRYLGDCFMTKDNTGKTVYKVVREWESTLRYDAHSLCVKIAIACLGGNLPEQVAQIKDLKFV